MHETLHPRDDLDRLYVSRKVRRGLASIKDCIDARTTRRLLRKVRRNYCHQKQYRQHENQQNRCDLNTKMGRKTTVWTFQTTNKRNLSIGNLAIAQGNLKRGIEPLLIAEQNNGMRTNYIKARIVETQQNSEYRLCGDLIISEFRNLTQKENKIRHD